MNNPDLARPADKVDSKISLRDLLTIAFRRKKIAAICFFGVMAGALLFVLFVPPFYSVPVKFLVQRSRVDAEISSLQTTPIAVSSELTEEDLNSEIGLLQDDNDVLREVVLACGLNKRKLLSEYLGIKATPEKRIQKAVKRLSSNLTIEVEKKSNIIDVSYTTTDPALGARVMRALSDAYIRKHMEVHSPPGQVQFFATQTDRYDKELADASAKLKELSTEQDGVAPTQALQFYLQKLAEFHMDLQTTRGLLAAAKERVQTLEKEAGYTPERLTTEMREEDDAQVLQGLKGTLMTVENKRTELLTKYQPDYPLVVEADKEIADTKAAIALEESKPVKAQTTDRNPTYSLVDGELAKAKADYASLSAQESAMQNILTKYEDRTRDLAQKGLIEQDLQRSYKASEQNYLLYLSKREQARTADALNTTRIVNVSQVEEPITPVLPIDPPLLVMVIATILAGMVAAGGVYIQEHLDPSFRTPAEVSAELDVPLLAAVPQKFEAFPRTGTYGDGNGNGNGNGNGRGRDRDLTPSVVPLSSIDQSVRH
jgi:uncharacterized protein involved in exopolysaccharide biosynthesis